MEQNINGNNETQTNSPSLPALCEWQVANSGGGQLSLCGLQERGWHHEWTAIELKKGKKSWE